MKILYIQDTDWIRRNPIQHNHLAERMVLRGHKVRVIDYEILWREEGRKKLITKKRVFQVSRLFDNAEHKVIRPGILKIPLLDYLSMLYTYKKEIINQIKEFQPDFIIGDGILIPYLAFKLAKKFNIKVIYYCIDLDYKLIPIKLLQPIGKILESYNMRNADLVISINEVLRDYTIKMGVDPKKTKIIRAGIDFNLFNSNVNGSVLRKRYGIKDDDILLFFVGWLYHFTGLKEVLLSLLKLKRENIKLLIVGDGDAYYDLQSIIKKYKMQHKIIMVGRKPYSLIPNFLAAADICLLPAYNNKIMRYIVPIKIYEYLAMKNPVVATKLPGLIKEFGYGNGITFIDKPEDTIFNVLDLIDNNKIETEGRKAKNFVKNNDWKKIVDDFEQTLRSLI